MLPRGCRVLDFIMWVDVGIFVVTLWWAVDGSNETQIQSSFALTMITNSPFAQQSKRESLV